MKTMILMSLLTCIPSFFTAVTKEIDIQETLCIIEQRQEYAQKQANIKKMQKLLHALMFVESGFKPDAVGDKHLPTTSVGILQIRQILVDDVNRIVGKPLYSYEDRLCKEKSIEMFLHWKNYYFSHTDDFQTIARSWNGGPMGWKKPQTIKYWNKVQYALNTLEKSNQIKRLLV